MNRKDRDPIARFEELKREAIDTMRPAFLDGALSRDVNINWRRAISSGASAAAHAFVGTLDDEEAVALLRSPELAHPVPQAREEQLAVIERGTVEEQRQRLEFDAEFFIYAELVAAHESIGKKAATTRGRAALRAQAIAMAPDIARTRQVSAALGLRPVSTRPRGRVR